MSVLAGAQRNGPQRIGLTAMLRDENAIEPYESAHAAIWPSVLHDAQNAGVKVTCIFRDGLRLFMYLEATADFDLAGFSQQLSSPDTRRWQQAMDALLADADGSLPGLKWRTLHVVATVA